VVRSILQLDSFSAAPYGGNPAAVLLLPFDLTLSDAAMATVAAENNLSEVRARRLGNKLA
jgi:predicted PhzF superfamily epimerase YddE/YHI9